MKIIDNCHGPFSVASASIEDLLCIVVGETERTNLHTGNRVKEIISSWLASDKGAQIFLPV